MPDVASRHWTMTAPSKARDMNDVSDPLAVALFSEVFMVDQLARALLGKALPNNMEISHFSILNHLAHVKRERSPAQLATTFNLTRGAITNTLKKLETAGHIHIRPDWDDGRRKHVAISPAGQEAREQALLAITPVIEGVVDAVGLEKVREALPVLREIRVKLSEDM